ncbi:helicase-related protein [Endosaccharibacter trunci]|uniref:helicase-related protein n=1 Tax=Endosaccharibacter trunci TaxID=2812733 RepID=UPI003BF511C3
MLGASARPYDFHAALFSGPAEGPRSGPFAPRVKAVLGPTNTGKTHLAMERLLAHGSGIIGFPLRLLARENYDRMVAAKGVNQVGLITGEEKIIPPGARWFSCTVEAMPLDEQRRPEFVAVDEIQLCADPDRGHVFTDRLLHARGTVETMFLGAETIRPLLHRLVPQAEIETRPRLSQLLNVGQVKLTKLPPRSAVVAFSAAEVYAIAELIRRRRGGCAVVMGRLSPRTRNAQVALYQNKEVDYLVATDAIGMGLNMDVNHVGFAGMSKFDGARPRRLTAAEVAQIAGRAGRGMRDGTFGTTGTCPPMPDDIIQAVEAHRFDPLEQLFWRNSDLDLGSPEALLASLQLPPPSRGLVAGNEASDLQTLAALAADPDIRKRAVDRKTTHLLWDACQIPDFRKLGDDSHTRLCARVFDEIQTHGRLPDAWLDSLLTNLDRADGDIDTLMQRLSGIRVCAYIAARRDWLQDAAHWQDRARAIEDVLSDALHERLTARFVDKRAALLIRSLDEADRGDGAELLSAVTARGEVVVEGHSVGHVSGFSLIPDPQAEGPEKRLVLRAARRALREEIPRRVQALATAPDGSFSIAEDGRTVGWDGAPVGRLRPGPTLLKPAVDVRDSEFLDGSQREQVRARLQLFVDTTIADTLAPLFAAEKQASEDGALRGVLHVLTEQAGLVPGPQRGPLTPEVRTRLKTMGVRAGRFALFMPALLKPKPARLRAILLSVRAGTPIVALPREGRVSVPVGEAGDTPAGMLPRLGWVVCGPVLLRLDVAEKIAGELGWITRRRPTALPPDLASRLSVRGEILSQVLPGLDIRMLPAFPLPDDAFGPPAPPLIAPRGERARIQGRHRDRRRPGASAGTGVATDQTAPEQTMDRETPEAVAAEGEKPAGRARRRRRERSGGAQTTPVPDHAPQAAEAGSDAETPAPDAGRRAAGRQRNRPRHERGAGPGPGQGHGQGHGQAKGQAKGQRPDLAARGENAPQQNRAPHQNRGPRPDGKPPRPPAPQRPPARPYNPDSPFAVLAGLRFGR